MVWNLAFGRVQEFQGSTRGDMEREDWSKPSSCCRRRKNLNSKAAVSLLKDVGDKKFSMEEVQFVEVSFFSYFHYV